MRARTCSVLLAAAFALGAATVASAQSPLTTGFAGGNRQNAGAGVFFDLQVNSPINVTSFNVNISATALAGTAFTVTVYRTAAGGTYLNNTTSSAAWTQVATGSGTSLASGQQTPVDVTDFALNPGTYGMVIVYTGVGPEYTNGNSTAGTQTPGAGTNQTFMTAEMTFRGGVVMAAPFTAGVINAPRIWNGSILYDVVSVNGACCRPNGTCTFGLASDCSTAPAGQFQNGTTTCTGVVCQQPVACCAPTNAGCTFLATFACTSPNVAMAAGSTCSPTNPCPGGACCKKDGSCTLTTGSWCPTAGGIYTSDTTTCAAAACPQPGSCCLPNAGCVALTAADCTAAAGTSGAPGSLCASAGCWTAPILYHNGGLVTHPAGATGGADACLIATGANSIGENWSLAAGVRVADDFTIPAGRTWTLTRFHTFGYQTNAATTPVPYTAMYVRIWDRDPRDPAAVAVWGDLTTNVLDLTASNWPNLYRVTALPGDTARAVFDLQASVPAVVLNSGTYWVEWSGANGATPFIPPVSSVNSGTVVLPFGNALIWRAAPWVPEVDISYQIASWANAGTGGAPLNLPFIFEGFTGVCCQSDGSCTANAAAGTPNPTCATGTYVASASCSPNSCPPPAGNGACCSGATCVVVANAAACTALNPTSTPPGANTRFVGTGSACNAPGNNTTPCCKADFNQSGGPPPVKTVQDLFDFLAAWFAKTAQADINGNPPAAGASVTVQDLFDFLAVWFPGC